MSHAQDDAEPKASLAGWWVAAAIAVAAVLGAAFLLSGARPSPTQLQVDQSTAQAAAHSAPLPAVHAAKAAQSATESHVRATETAAQVGAADAGATALAASTEPVATPEPR